MFWNSTLCAYPTRMSDQLNIPYSIETHITSVNAVNSVIKVATTLVP